MKKNLQIIALLNSVMLVAACQSVPSYVVKDLPERPKPPVPAALNKDLPPQGYFQTELESILDSLADPSTYLSK